MDRALSADEPRQLVHYPVAPKSMFGTTTIRYGFTSGGLTVVAPLIGGRDPEIQWMKDLMSPDTYWVFQVYNDRAGHLIVTAAQPTTAD